MESHRVDEMKREGQFKYLMWTVLLTGLLTFLFFGAFRLAFPHHNSVATKLGVAGLCGAGSSMLAQAICRRLFRDTQIQDPSKEA